MKNNNLNNYIQEDEIDLKKIVKLLINSTKLIIVITFVTTILTAIYASQKEPQYISSALIEIGSYDSEINDLKGNDYGNTLIEKPAALIQNLNINFIHRQELNLEIEPIEGRLIRINTNSPNVEINIDLLNKIIGFIQNRHSNLLQKKVYKLTSEIKFKDIEIEFEKAKIAELINTLNRQIINLDSKIKSLNDIVGEDTRNLELLKSNPELLIQRASVYPSLNQLIFAYKNEINEYEDLKISTTQQIENLERSNKVFKLSQDKNNLVLKLEFLTKQNSTKTQLIGKIDTRATTSKKILTTSLLGFIFGLFISIFMVLILNFLKTFKDELA
jgi:hypothetical protein